MEAIQAVGLTKKYKDLTAVDSLDLSIGQGELFSFIGRERRGKNHDDQNALLPDKAHQRQCVLCGKSIVFKQAACLLPFGHAVEMERAVISGNYA